jgi:hypothetical protein
MKKSKLSVFSLTCGIITTTMSGILFPIAVITKSPSGVMLVGFLSIFTIFMGVAGIVSSTLKLLITGNLIVEDQENRIIAKKGFWFSIIPTVFWIFIMIIGSAK